MRRKTFWYLGLGLLCLCMIAVFVSAGTSTKPQPGMNGPLALKQELRWLEANGMKAPAEAARYLSTPSTSNRPGDIAIPHRQTSGSVNVEKSATSPAEKRVAVRPHEDTSLKAARLLSKYSGERIAMNNSTSKTADRSSASRPSMRRHLDEDLLLQGFEEGIMPPTGWTVQVLNTTETWESTSLYTPYEGTYAANCEYDANLALQDEWIISPVIDLTTATGTVFISFWWQMSYYWGVTPYENYDLELRISLDGGTTWDPFVLWADDSIGVFTSWAWTQANIDLSAYQTNNNVKLAWRYYGTDGAQAMVDAIRLYTREECTIVCAATDSVEAVETADSTWMSTDPNGGCNNVAGSYFFGAANCGDTLCGNVFTYLTPGGGQTRDMDWYQFTITTPETISVWAQGQFPITLFLAAVNCPTTTLLNSASADYCVPVNFGACLRPGTYALIVAPSVFTGVDTPAPYRAVLTCHGSCTPPPNYDCATPYVLPADTGVFSGFSTCTAYNDYSETCLGYYDGGEDMIFTWTVVTPGDYKVTLNPMGTSYTGIAISAACPLDSFNCLGQSTNAGTGQHNIVCQNYAAGTYYIMVDTYPAPDCIPSFDLVIRPCTPPQPWTCEAPYVLPTETGVFTDLTTCGALNDYSETCLGSYDGGEDIILQWTVTTAGTYMISVDPLGTSYTGFAVHNLCPLDATTCLLVATNYGVTPYSAACTFFAAGTYYIMVDTYPSPDCIPTFTMTIDTCTIPTGRCCYGEDPYNPLCVTNMQVECAALGGVWIDSLDCETSSCPLPPANDTCGAAIEVAVGSNTLGTTVASLPDAWAPACGVTITTGGVWYKVTGDGTTLTASTCNAVTTYDSKIHVYCGSCRDLVCVGANDDNCAAYGLRSSVSWCSQVGATYYILVHGYSAATGDFQLDVTTDGVACVATVNCKCLGVNNATVVKGTDGLLKVRFSAPENGVYYIWATTNKNNDGDPNGGLDPDFTLSTSLLSMAAPEVLTWVDPTIVSYKNYIVTSECGPEGRCCYGPDPEDLTCVNVPRAVCSVLGGTWRSGITCETFPCNCPAGSIPENEPDCADEYVDVTNGGCNSTPNVFGTIACGQTICGTSGTYLYQGGNSRDTDWFQITTTEADSFVWTVRAEFDVSAFILTGTCANITTVASGSALAGQELVVSVPVCQPAGTYWLWVGPSAFAGVPCGAKWYGTLTCTPCTPPPSYDCAAPFILPTQTGTFTGLSTCGSINDYSNTCLDLYDGGEDVIFQWTVTNAGGYEITLDPQGSFYTGFLVSTECPPPATGCFGYTTSWDDTAYTLRCTNYPAGTYYIMVDTWPAPDCIPSFSLTINACTIEECTPDYTLEGTGTVTGNTCGAGDDCDPHPGFTGVEDQIVQISLTEAGRYTFSLCSTSPSWDTWMALDASCCAASHIAFSDDACGALSEIAGVELAAGVYYIVIEGYSGTTCGAWTLVVSRMADCVWDMTMDAPGQITGNTCGAVNDCPARTTEDQIVQVNVATAGTYTFSLCNTNPAWDTYLFLDASCCAATHLGLSDDYCGSMSQIDDVDLDVGTYYITVEGWSGCGAWTLDVTASALREE